MISIKRFLDQSTQAEAAEAIEAMVRAFDLVLQGLRLHAVLVDQADFDTFRSTVRKIEKSFSADPSAAAALRLATETNGAIQEYHQRIERVLRAKSAEIISMMAMLADAVVRIGRDGSESTERLREVEKKIAYASRLSDIRQLKGQLADVLRAIEKERELRDVSSESLISSLSARLPAEDDQSDPVTGLAPASAAEREIDRLAGRGGAYAVCFVLGLARAIEARNGGAVADEMLRVCAQRIAQRLRAGDQLFRWRGPAVVAVIERAGGLDVVRQEMAALAPLRDEHTIAGPNGRGVTISLTASWIPVPLLEADVARAKLKDFVETVAERR